MSWNFDTQRLIDAVIQKSYGFDSSGAIYLSERNLSSDVLREETERLQLLSEAQVGFRKGKSCIDNIHIMKAAAEKMINKKNGKCRKIENNGIQ